jgi:hypothetical protein
MLRSTLRKLAKGLTSTSRRPARAATRRPTPAVEGLEDRMVLSTTAFTGPTLSIFASPGTATQDRAILLTRDHGNSSLLDVFDGPTLLGRFKAADINRVNVTVSGHDAVNVDDSNGFPFAPGTVVLLNGGGVGNSLNLGGSLAIGASEAYDGGFGGGLGQLSLGGSLFQFSSAIRSVTDDVTITGTLFVNALGHNVALSGTNGITDTLSGLADGGAGDTLTFLGKPQVSVAPNLDGSTVTLAATKAAVGLKTLTVNVVGNKDVVNVNATPSTVSTVIDVHGQQDQVNVRANAGAVTVNGNKTTTVILGSNDTDFSKSVTSGIVGNVSVSGAGTFEIADGGNVKTKEEMQVTESQIFGFGMFGSNTTVVRYADAAPIIVTGQLANGYTVAPSHPGARFNDDIFILDEFSNAGINVFAGMDSGSGLHLHLFNKDASNGFLTLVAVGGTFTKSSTPPSITETATFKGGLTSTVSYIGFDHVTIEPYPANGCRKRDGAPCPGTAPRLLFLPAPENLFFRR